MLKTRRSRLILAAFSLSAFMFFSCSEKSPTSSNMNDRSSEFGQAVVQLPDLSSSALQKKGAVIESNALTLLIFGSGMDTMKLSWPVGLLKGQKVNIQGIPAGTNRYFQGFLTNKTGIITHTGKVAVEIIAGQIVPVYLKLSGTGAADVCIIVEGYPSSCSSIKDTVLLYNCLKGYTPNGKQLTGWIKLYYSMNYASGYVMLHDTGAPKYYYFENNMMVNDSAGYRYCRAKVRESNTYYGLFMLIKDSTIMSGYIDSVPGMPVIKFYAVPCASNDTTYFKTTLTGRGYSPDTSVFNVTLSCKIFNDTVTTGTLYFYNWNYVNFTSLNFTGSVYSFDIQKVFMLKSKDSSGCVYETGLKYNPTMSSGYISRIGGNCKPGSIANLSTK